MRKIILYIAVTLDGFIADENDGFSFLNEYDDLESVQNSYQQLMTRVDTLIMGRVTYEVIKKNSVWPYEGYECFVLTKQSDRPSDHRAIFIDHLDVLVEDLKGREGKDIWLVGGGNLIESFLKQDLIDEYQIAIIPKLIGRGKRLFTLSDIKTKLKLTQIEKMDEIVMVTYSKK
jgi:dihydrofolate reductase